MSEAAARFSQFQDGAERRKHPRVHVLESGLLYGDGGCIDCQVIDVSANGARIRPVGELPTRTGACRFLLARLGMFPAKIRWSANGQAGVAFEAPPEDVLERCAPLLAGAGA